MPSLESATQLLFAGRISRREFLKRASALGIGAAAASSLIAPLARAAEPKRGGTLKIGVNGGSTTDSMDPATAYDDAGYLNNFTTYNNLVELSADKKPIPELAESWDSNKELTQWTFKLRDGVVFHNGKTLDADDVVYSLKRHIGKDSKSAAKGMMASINDIKTDGKHSVVIMLANGNADVPYILTDFHLGIVPKDFSDWTKPIGTGPYRMTHFEPGVLVESERNPNYWKQGRAWVDAVSVTVINDGTARINALRTRDVHAINSVDTSVAKLVGEISGVNLVDSPALYMYDAPMNTTLAPYKDNNVRLALKYACDREQMLTNGLRGYGKLGADTLIPPTDPFYNTELKPHAYDPDKARHYLKQAGLDSLSVELITSTGAFPESNDYGALYQQAAKKAGITIKTTQAPADGYWSNIWLKKPFCMAYWGTRPTPDMMLSMVYQCGAPWNETHWCRKDFDKLLLEARVTLDVDKRKQQYWELQKMIHDDGGTVLMTFADALDAYHESVKGTAPDGYRALMGCRVAERVWLES